MIKDEPKMYLKKKKKTIQQSIFIFVEKKETILLQTAIRALLCKL